ncbi:MAG: hypothetical protein ACK4WC_04250 [Rubrimonas sp.]
MTEIEAGEIVDAALELIAVERMLLLSGRIDALEQAALEREAALAELEPLDPWVIEAIAPKLDALRAAAERNATLLRAAMEGAAAARRRIEAIRNAPARLDSYGPTGAPVQRTFGNSTGRRV